MSRTNNIQFIMTFSAPAEHVAEGDRIFNSHAKWMERTHYKDGDKALLIYDVSKAPEMADPMDPDSRPTGNTIFAICEVYKSPAGLQDHWQQAQDNWEDFGALNEWMENCELTMVNGAKVLHSLW